MFWRIIVFPALGGETINDLCPFPIGLTKSINRAVLSGFFSILVVSISNLILSFGYSGVKLSKAILFFPFSGSSKLILLTFNNAKYLSASFGPLISPSTESPVLKPNLLIWLGLTYMSSGPGR